MSDRTIGLVGYGHNGQAMAKKLSGFDVKVIAYDKYRKDYGDEYAQEATLDMLFEQTDVLSLHIPLTGETKSLVSTDYINKFTKPFYLLNGSRGEVADMEAIVAELAKGKIMGGAFDVLPVEKFPALNSERWFAELKKFPNVILSPHVAGWTVESYIKIARVLAEKLVKAF